MKSSDSGCLYVVNYGIRPYRSKKTIRVLDIPRYFSTYLIARFGSKGGAFILQICGFYYLMEKLFLG